MATNQNSDPTSGAPFPTSKTAGAAAAALDKPGQASGDKDAGASAGSSEDGATGSSGNGGATSVDAGKPNDVMNQVVQMAHDTIDKLAERAAPKVQRIQEGVAQTNQMLHDGAGNLRDMGDEWTDTLRCTVRENPLTALAAAAAVGMLLAYLMRSSD